MRRLLDVHVDRTVAGSHGCGLCVSSISGTKGSAEFDRKTTTLQISKSGNPTSAGTGRGTGVRTHSVTSFLFSLQFPSHQRKKQRGASSGHA